MPARAWPHRLRSRFGGLAGALAAAVSPAETRVLLLVALTTAARAACIAIVPLLDDEAYYWDW